MKMRTAKLMLWPLSKMPVRFYAWTIEQTRVARPPKDIAKKHEVTVENIEGVDVTWIDRKKASVGVLVFTHGGGYTAGPFLQHWRWLTELCDRVGFAGVLIDYRKAGQAPYPAALDDVQKVIEGIAEDGALASDKWAIVGDSAGGGIALIMCRRLMDIGGPVPKALVVASPFVDMRLDNPEIPVVEKRDLSLSRALLELGISQYAPGEDRSNPELSPTEADLTGFPPIIMCAGTDEIFLPDLRIYRQKLEDAGVIVEYFEEEGAIHSFPIISGSEESERALDRQTRFLQLTLGLQRPT